jgi:hypothetical protein
MNSKVNVYYKGNSNSVTECIKNMEKSFFKDNLRENHPYMSYLFSPLRLLMWTVLYIHPLGGFGVQRVN